MQYSTQINSGRKVLVAAIFGSLLGATIGAGGAGLYLVPKSEKQQQDWLDSVAAMNLRLDRLASSVEQSNYHDKQVVLRTSGVNAVRGAGGTLTDSQLDAAIKGFFDTAGLPADEAMSGASEPVRIEDSAPAEQPGEKMSEQEEAEIKAYSESVKSLAKKFVPAEDEARSEESVEAPAAKG